MIDKSNIAKIHKDLSDLLKKYASENNFSCSGVNLTYTSSGFRFKCEMGDKSELGDSNPTLVRNLERFGFLVSLDKSHLGKTFKSNGFDVTLEGMNNKQTVVFKKDGKLYKTKAVMFAKENNLKYSALLS
jgi:hypothetical protein